MNHEPREPAAAESYPTFWDDTQQTPAFPVQAEEAYAAFIRLTEAGLPDGTVGAGGE